MSKLECRKASLFFRQAARARQLGKVCTRDFLAESGSDLVFFFLQVYSSCLSHRSAPGCSAGLLQVVTEIYSRLSRGFYSKLSRRSSSSCPAGLIQAVLNVYSMLICWSASGCTAGLLQIDPQVYSTLFRSYAQVVVSPVCSGCSSCLLQIVPQVCFRLS